MRFSYLLESFRVCLDYKVRCITLNLKLSSAIGISETDGVLRMKEELRGSFSYMLESVRGLIIALNFLTVFPSLNWRVFLNTKR